MKIFAKLLLFPAVIASLAVMASCKDDDEKSTWESFADWRNINVSFFDEQKYSVENGVPIYSTLSPSWNPGAQILIKYLNDRSKTEGNLSPMLNSTCSVKYIGRLYNGQAFDSSYMQTDSVSLFMPSEVIQGWTIALTSMRVGDSARIIIPYMQGYGSTGSRLSSGDYLIPPYSTLVFDLKLVDIPYYEVRP